MSPRHCNNAAPADDSQICPRCGERHGENHGPVVVGIQLTTEQLNSMITAETRSQLRAWLQQQFPYGAPPMFRPLVDLVNGGQ